MPDARINVPSAAARGKPFEVRIISAKLSSGIAANPYLRFFVTAKETGNLTFEWIDDSGAQGSASAPVTVV